MTTGRTILVGPVEGGWAVACEAAGEPMLFLSGARAEAHARALAVRLSHAGDEIDLVIRDRSQAMVGSVRYRACELS
jgi:hypothetical protein